MPGIFYGTSQSYYQQPPNRVAPTGIFAGALTYTAAADLRAAQVITYSAAATLIVAPAPAINTLPNAGPFSVSDWGRRLVALLPQPWFPSSSLVAGSPPVAANEIPIGSIMQGLGSGFAAMFAQLTYAQMQARIATATDTNIDQASIDLFGGVLPRIAGETDALFSARVRQLATAQQPTIGGMQAVLSAYLRSLLLSQRELGSLAVDAVGGLDGIGATDVALPSGITPPVQAFGSDTLGAADTYGFLDEQSSVALVTPFVYVFDNQSDPVTSAYIALKPPQFGVALLFPGVNVNLLHVDPTPYVPTLTFAPIAQAFSADVAGSLDNIGTMDEVIPPTASTAPGASVYFNQQFVNLVYWMRAQGTSPVLCTNGFNI